MKLRLRDETKLSLNHCAGFIRMDSSKIIQKVKNYRQTEEKMLDDLEGDGIIVFETEQATLYLLCSCICNVCNASVSGEVCRLNVETTS
jgi:hypothetical protein